MTTSQRPRAQLLTGGHQPSANEAEAWFEALRQLGDQLRAQDDTFSVRGPFLASSQGAEVERIQQFRNLRYRGSQSYLLCEEQLEIERRLDLDGRSVHFAVERHGQVVGCVRTTPPPFEFASLAASLASLGPLFTHHVELSRLVISQAERGSGVTTRLLVAACAWAMTNGYVGIVGLCRRRTRPLMERFGLTAVSETQHAIHSRPGEPYTLMAGTWPSFAATATRLGGRFTEGRTAS